MMTTAKRQEISKFLSYVLRHNPDEIALTLTEHGWANIDELIEKANKAKSIGLTQASLKEVVDTNDKKRFVISEDGLKIRAAQGHSIAVDLQLAPAMPPDILYHGTASRFLANILKEGLKPQQRQHVHLSAHVETAMAVGKRYGTPVILRVDAKNMVDDQNVFYCAENSVWLTATVATRYLTVG